MMKPILTVLLGWAVTCSVAIASPLVLGDSGVAVRSDPATIDVDATLKQLDAMKVNTYLYDLPHGTDAWAKLPAFLDAAAKQGIQVYVWIEPWTLAERRGVDESSEPFGLDFYRWFKEVGELSTHHANLLGVVMDDFASNAHQPDRFTPESVAKMLAAGRAENPKLQFKPILYFNDPWDELIERFGPQFGDGVIVCYPRSDRELRATIPYLVDGDRGASLDVELPKRHHVRPGEGTFASAVIEKELLERARTLAFYFDDQNPTTKRGRHRVSVQLGDKVLWDRVLASESVDGEVKVPLPSLRSGERLTIGVVSEEPSEEASVRIRLDNIRFENEQGKHLAHQPKWSNRAGDELQFEVANPHEGQHRWNIPMTLMVAGAPFEDKKRFNEEGDADHIRKRLGDAVAWSKAGLANGVILFWTPKDQTSDLPGMVANVFGSMSSEPTARE